MGVSQIELVVGTLKGYPLCKMKTSEVENHLRFVFDDDTLWQILQVLDKDQGHYEFLAQYRCQPGKQRTS